MNTKKYTQIAENLKLETSQEIFKVFFDYTKGDPIDPEDVESQKLLTFVYSQSESHLTLLVRLRRPIVNTVSLIVDVEDKLVHMKFYLSKHVLVSTLQVPAALQSGRAIVKMKNRQMFWVYLKKVQKAIWPSLAIDSK